jgi:hypothetical protein
VSKKAASTVGGGAAISSEWSKIMRERRRSYRANGSSSKPGCATGPYVE